MTLSIIIVNHNVRCFLEQCLYSLRAAAVGIDHEVIVVDNASYDDSRQFLPERFPEVRYLWNEQNQGFGRACNQGTRISSGRHILFLNPDTIVPEDCLERCLHHFEQHPAVGALGVRMHNGSGVFLRESKRSFPTPSTAFLKLSGLSALFPQSPLFARYHLGEQDAFQNCEADILAGAFMMLRREAVEATGGFDEHFFMFGEDIDLSWRLRQAGFLNYYLAQTAILHFKGESNRRDTFRHVKYFYGAMTVFVGKHHPGWMRPLLWVGIGLRASATLMRIAMSKMWQWLRLQMAGYVVPQQGALPTLLVSATDTHLAAVSSLLPLRPPRSIERCVPEKLRIRARQDQTGEEPVREWLACPPACRYADVIELLASLPGRYCIRIAAEGSGSLVGSGLAMAVPQS
ncbi:MAG: glycosyltransferase [Bacteroidetes bacterium]|nr:glycosyltransferase [Bacteroidota bacterium]